jgi:ubiquinone/menaquinone biosynthesis C-methylase UbiE
VSQFPGPGQYTIVKNYEDCYSLDFLKKGQEFMYPERRRTLQDIVDRMISIKPNGRILDVGCGDGHFLYLCKKKSLDCCGVEPSKQLSSYASSKTGSRIVQGLYSKEMFPESHFDIVSFIQVLEHIPRPIAVLETANYHLSFGGLCVIEIPSIHSPHFLAYQWTGIKWFVRPPGGVIHSHVGYYTPKTLLTLTEKCGFRKVLLMTGRWQYKYSGLLKQVGKIIDPLLNKIKVGGILYIGEKY